MKKIHIFLVKNKNIVIISFVVIASVTFFGRFLITHRQNLDDREQIVSTTTPQQATTKTTIADYEEHTNLFDIEISLPHTGDSYFDKDRRDFFIKKVKAFEQEVVQNDQSIASNDMPQVKSSYTVDTKKVYEDDLIISFVSSEEFYNKGAAHPAHHTSTFVYDKVKKRVMSLHDIFIENDDTFYTKLESIVFEKEKIQLEKAFETKLDKVGLDWIHAGLSVNETVNPFETFTLSKDGVTFYFNEYVLAPYVAGPQEVFVSFDELKAFKK